ncbi:MAG: hypothetical protein ABII25_00325 [bacterium]
MSINIKIKQGCPRQDQVEKICYICKGKNGHHEIHCSKGRCSCYDGSGIICEGSLNLHSGD